MTVRVKSIPSAGTAHRHLAPFLERNGATSRIERVYRHYCGKVPSKVWHALVKRLLELDRQAYFFPLDAMDAYQDAVLCLEGRAANMPPLKNATRTTYLISTAKKALWRFHVSKVIPAREAYREIEDQLFSQEALECCDCDDDKVLSLQQLAEALPGAPSAEERRRFAASSIDEILDALDNSELVRAFSAYIVADGNFAEAAHLAQISTSRFYAMWHTWLATAHKAAETIKVRI